MKMRMRQAIAQAIADEMRADPTVVLMGEDIAEAEGPFKTSEGLLEEFGSLRVRDTPISEMGFCGAALGAAATGLRPIVEIMFVEFIGVALDMVTTEAAKFRYLSGGQYTAPLVVRASTGAGLGFGAQHSQTLESWFISCPGLKVVVPSGARTAYGLLRSAIRDPDPVVVLESRVLYAEREETVTGEEGVIPLGVGELLRSGTAATVVSIGQMVGRAAQALENGGVSADLIDLRTLVPWDRGLVESSVARTGRLVIVEESPYTGGWGTDVAAHVASTCFSSLTAPIVRITCPDVPVPYPAHLEQVYLPSVDGIVEAISHVVTTGTRPMPWWQKEGFVG
jgi:pyruvate dehydrogenase E1 component beta subunit